MTQKIIFLQNKCHIWIEKPKINKSHWGTLCVTPEVFVWKPKNVPSVLKFSEFLPKTESIRKLEFFWLKFNFIHIFSNFSTISECAETKKFFFCIMPKKVEKTYKKCCIATVRLLLMQETSSLWFVSFQQYFFQFQQYSGYKKFFRNHQW